MSTLEISIYSDVTFFIMNCYVLLMIVLKIKLMTTCSY